MIAGRAGKPSPYISRPERRKTVGCVNPAECAARSKLILADEFSSHPHAGGLPQSNSRDILSNSSFLEESINASLEADISLHALLKCRAVTTLMENAVGTG